MARVTIEVPQALVGDIYVAVGRVLRDAKYAAEAQSSADDAGSGDPDAAGAHPGSGQSGSSEA